MKTLRRLYTYFVVIISLEVVIWGLIRLARTLTNPSLEGNADSLAGALALIFVGLPIFLFHWRIAQRRAFEDEEERFCFIRALFFYGIFLGTLVPVVQNILAFLNRILIKAVNLPPYQTIFGGGQIWSDNLIAVFMNVLVGGYMFYQLQKDWDFSPPNENLANIRRLSRYILLSYGLGLLIGGSHELIRYLFTFSDVFGQSAPALMMNGLSLIIIGTPLWYFTWRNIQRSLESPRERTALLRQLFLFLLSLLSLMGILIPLGMTLNTLLGFALGDPLTIRALLSEIGDPLALALPLGGVWLYYSAGLRRTFTVEGVLKRANLFRRLYYYIQAALGLIATLIGLQMLLRFLIDFFVQDTFLWGESLRGRLTASLASLIVGVPLWILNWRKMQVDSDQDGELGDRARRSLIRKTYLYLALFSGVIGTMISAGYVAFVLFKALLGQADPDFITRVLKTLSSLILFGGILLAYHLYLLRKDNKRAHRFLENLHKKFPVLMLTSQEGNLDSILALSFQQEMPSIPFAVHSVENGVPDETMSQAQAVILPSQIASNPTEAIRVWLKNFSGQRLVLPVEVKRWHWVFGSGRTPSEIVKRTVRVIREMAEGDEISDLGKHSPLKTVLYVFGILFGIEILFIIISFLVSLSFN